MTAHAPGRGLLLITGIIDGTNGNGSVRGGSVVRVGAGAYNLLLDNHCQDADRCVLVMPVFAGAGVSPRFKVQPGASDNLVAIQADNDAGVATDCDFYAIVFQVVP